MHIKVSPGRSRVFASFEPKPEDFSVGSGVFRTPPIDSMIFDFTSISDQGIIMLNHSNLRLVEG
jgi:hypothetical protein